MSVSGTPWMPGGLSVTTIDRTKSFRKTGALFVLFKGHFSGNKASTSTLARWLNAIIKAYEVSDLSLPEGITAHSIRGAATSAAFEGLHCLEDICRAVTWATPSTFICHYRIDKAASATAAFGRRVLPKSFSGPIPHPEGSYSSVTSHVSPSILPPSEGKKRNFLP